MWYHSYQSMRKKGEKYMKTDNFLYNERVYTIHTTLKVKEEEYVIASLDGRYSCFKHKVINERDTYTPFFGLMLVLPQYQNIGYQNFGRCIHIFLKKANLGVPIEKLEEAFYHIWEVSENDFHESAREELSLDYFDAFYQAQLTIYQRKSMAELLELNPKVEKEEKKEKYRPTSSRVWFPFKRFAYMCLVAISVIGFMECFDTYASWKEEGKEVNALTNTLVDDAAIEEIAVETPVIEEPAVESNTNTNSNSSSNSSKKTTKKKESDYYSYTKTSMINVDFTKLKKKNSDTVGWIYVPNTNINYPFVQTKDNSYYLDRAFDRTKNGAGWIFADYRSDLKNFKNNTVIYGHGRVDNVMFGTLEKTLKKSWYTNKENQIIKMSTPYENTLWQVFSIYTIKAESYYLTHNFENDESYQKFLDTITKRSIYDFGVDMTTNDKVLTLSTCLNYDGDRIVVHAKLIQRQAR